MPHDDWRIVLDLPAKNPKLGFDRYAQALVDIIRESEPRFAIGVFGGWGSGKSTLMEQIHKRLKQGNEQTPRTIAVDFSAWRYEKEDHLIVPLLDAIRKALVDWGKEHAPVSDAAQKVARVVGGVTKAIVSGFSFKLGPEAAQISFEANKAIKTTGAVKRSEELSAIPRSFYFAVFEALRHAFVDFAENDPKRRIVVFVDDLDRCLPSGALQVIESMKLFFDLPGFVFVVGLDRKIVEWSIDQTYAAASDQREEVHSGPVRGSDYLKKIFQVPFSLPTVTYEQIEKEFLDDVCLQAELPQSQQDQIKENVLRHLKYLVTKDGINPREIKRYINAYSIAMKTWPPERPDPVPDIILALHTVSFRSDWKVVSDTLVGSTEGFLQALSDRILNNNYKALANLDPNLAGVPGQFLEYVAADGPAHVLIQAADQVPEYLEIGAPMLRFESDEPCVSPTLRKEQGEFRDLRTPALEAGPPGSQVNVLEVDQLIEKLSEKQRYFGSEIPGQKGSLIDQGILDLKVYMKRFASENQNGNEPEQTPEDWSECVNEAFDSVLATIDGYFRESRAGRGRLES